MALINSLCVKKAVPYGKMVSKKTFTIIFLKHILVAITQPHSDITNLLKQKIHRHLQPVHGQSPA